jgi:hypothetical protein
MPRNSIGVAATLILLMLSGCKGPEGPMGPAGQGIESLSDPNIMPKVIYTYPPQNSIGPYENFYLSLGWIYAGPEPGFIAPIYVSQFQVRFNKYMNISSLRRAIAITSPSGDIGVDTNYILSIGGDVFLINPVDSNGNRMSDWKIDQNYFFTISSVARDINNNPLQPPFSMSFMPEPYFRIRTTTPPNGATNISPSSYSIMLNFNSPVDTSIFSSIQIVPPIFGQWYISYDTFSVYYSSNQLLKNGTTYTVTVGSQAHDAYGNHLQQPFILTFRSLPFEISYTSPGNHASLVSPQQPVYIEFSAPVDTSTIRTAFSIRPTVAGQLNIYPTAYFEFDHLTEYTLDTTYTVTIDTSLRSSEETKLATPYTFSFRVAPFQVSSTYPYAGMTNFDRTSYIQVYCNALIDTSTIRSSYTLVDSSHAPVSGTFVMDTNGFIFTPSSPLTANAIYTITIGTGLRSKQGSYLKGPLSIDFITGN